MTVIINPQSASNSGILTSAGTALAAETGRQSFKITNLGGSNPIFVKFGAGASATDFDVNLAAGTGVDDGTGASYDSPSTVCWSGIISVAGTSPRFIASQTVQY